MVNILKIIRVRARLTRRRSIVAIAILPIFGMLSASAAFANEAAELFKGATLGSTRIVDHSTWDRLLKTYVHPDADGLNRVDYAAFKSRGREALDTYISYLQSIDPATLGRAEQFAYLANLYNAKTVAIVVEKYPVDSIKAISLGGNPLAMIAGGPWKAKVLEINGVGLSLDDIEHEILRPLFKDPRVHYAVNCASIGCPNLRTEAFTGTKLNAQLDAAARAYVNHSRGLSIGPNGVMVSSIYRWFKADFGGEDAGVLAHLRKYAVPSLAQKLETIKSIDGYSYDWSLNDLQH